MSDNLIFYFIYKHSESIKIPLKAKILKLEFNGFLYFHKQTKSDWHVQ
jgi:hypothetical protein